MYKSSYYVIAAAVIIASAAFAGKVFLHGESPDFASSVVPAPQFELKDYGGNVVKISDFKGKPVIVNAWATWCPFCVKELPDFAKISEEFGGDVIIIAVDRQEPLAVAKGFTDKLGITNKLIFLLDPDNSFYTAIGGFSMPETIFVDRNGNIRDHKRGPMKVQEIKERLKKIL